MSESVTDANYEAILNSLAPLPSEARTIVADQLVAELQKEFAFMDSGLDLIIKDLSRNGKFYAVHNDDLEILKVSAAVAVAIYTNLSNPAAVIAGLLIFLYRFRKKRIALHADEALALMIISSAGAKGIGVSSLWDEFNEELRIKVNIQPVLERLSEARRQDGTVTNLIELKDGKYFALDV